MIVLYFDRPLLRDRASQSRLTWMTRSIWKMTGLWNVTPCRLVDSGRHFRGVYYPDDGGSKFLWNVGQNPSICTVQHSRNQSSSHSSIIELPIYVEYFIFRFCFYCWLLEFWDTDGGCEEYSTKLFLFLPNKVHWRGDYYLEPRER